MNPHLQKPIPKCLPIIMGLVIILLSLLKIVDAASAPIVAKQGCPDSCGNVSIPFPFGIGNNCFLNSQYEIKCNTSTGSTKAFLAKFDIEVMEITLPSHDNNLLSSVIVAIPSLIMCGANTEGFSAGIDFRGSPYNFSTDANVFVAQGCPGSTVLINESNTVIAGCGTVCHNKNNSVIFTNKCLGVDCCQMALPSEKSPLYIDYQSPLQFYQIGFNGKSSGKHHNCLVATLIKKDFVDQYIGKLSASYPSTVPVLLYWSWMNNHQPNFSSHAHCLWDEEFNITRCYCDENSVGNPYLWNGCQVPEECKHHVYCTWNPGNSSYNGQFSSTSNLAYEVNIDASTCFECLRTNPANRAGSPFYNMTHIKAICAVGIYLSAAVGPLLVVFGCLWLYRFLKMRKKTNQRVKIFKLKLQQHTSSNDGVAERTKLFTYKQLDKATNHFNENRILGQGGQGTVYKGMLTDGKIVAVKTSKLMDESQMEQFINEVVILSQINHRNVVKLLGCCLQKQVPLLVYEFISNGTLSQHLHDPDDEIILNWPMRLKIAADSAGAIAYLHSSSSTPIYHRDIKPSNILLDDKHRAKISDFGCSKTIALDQTHLTTLVQGTIGYLDPEYFESNVFTEKSDVYSFGVVLLELLTSKKPIYRTEIMEQKSLVVEFFHSVQNCSVFDILDPKVVKEAKDEELIAAINLAKQCLNENGRFRPTMKEVAMRLEMIIKSPGETSSCDVQSFPNERLDEIEMPETSNLEFMSSLVPTGSPLYIDVHPLLHSTI